MTKNGLCHTLTHTHTQVNNDCDDHDLIATQNNLGMALLNLGRAASAEPLLKAALQGCRKLDNNHGGGEFRAHTVIAAHNLATAQLALGQYVRRPPACAY